MPIYYQKHRQINATQFDGQLTTLQKILPPHIFEDLINRCHNDRPFAAYQIDIDPKTNLIMTLHVDDNFIHWNHFRGKHHYQNSPNQFHHNHGHEWRHPNFFNTEIQQGHYVETRRNLHYGDYLIIKPVLFMDPGDYFDHYQHRYYYFDYVVVIPKQHFETHWSKTPIRKK